MGKFTEAKVRTTKATDKDQCINDGAGLYLRAHKGAFQVVDYTPQAIRQNANYHPCPLPLYGGERGTVKGRRVLAKKGHIQYQCRSSGKQVSGRNRPHYAEGYFIQTIFHRMGHRKVRDVTRADLVELIQYYSKRSARTADSLCSYLKKLLGYNIELGYIDNNPMNDVSRE